MKNVRYPTPAELYALDQAARRARAREIARLLRSAALAVKSLFARAPSAARVHGQVARHA